MTPQQKKADELVGRFKDHAHMNWDEYHGWDEKQGEVNAIQCAIICVEEILKALDSVLDSRRHFRTIHENEVYDELQSVLNELKSRL